MKNKLWSGFLLWIFLVSTLVSLVVTLGVWAVFAERKALNDFYDPSVTDVNSPLYKPENKKMM